MHKPSFIYRHILLYRLVMNLLYFGRYKQRFAPVIENLTTLRPGSRIVELCFGDTYVADFCRKNGYKWTGFDINPHFVDRARKLGLDARFADLLSTDKLPKADVCIMMGSLYHFHPNEQELLGRMLEAAETVIISEPILNLSAKRGFIGFFARRSANPGNGHQSFRHNKKTFLDLLERCRAKLNVGILAKHEGRDLTVMLTKNENHQP